MFSIAYNRLLHAFYSEGNTFFKKGQFQNAIDKYQLAANIDPSEPAYWSNMAACYEKIGNFEEMANASQSCIKADKTFVKGYFRLATAQKNLNDLSSELLLSFVFFSYYFVSMSINCFISLFHRTTLSKLK
jgi:tetratricopeptide (TPR) repeat protein